MLNANHPSRDAKWLLAVGKSFQFQADNVDPDGAAETNVGAMHPALQSFARIRARHAKKLAAVLALGTAMVALAPYAYADGGDRPVVGSECWHYQLNTVTTGTTGLGGVPPVRVRCVPVPGAGYKWQPDIGPEDP